MIDSQQKCGFITILGATNAGKSTLVNQLVGQKVSIVTHKVQTTRQRILGIAMCGSAQLILVDTPGIFNPKRSLEKAMVDCAWRATADADVQVVVFDVNDKRIEPAIEMINKAHSLRSKAPLLLALNKIDTIAKEQLLKLIELFKDTPVQEIYLISALNGDGINDLKNKLVELVPNEHWLFPDDEISDVPMRSWAAEITREKLFLKLHQELPYELMVETEAWEEFDNGSVKITQVIYVNRANHKGIVLGNSGKMIKSISQAARTELSEQLGRPVHLFLHVKVAKDWMEKVRFLRLIGLE